MSDVTVYRAFGLKIRSEFPLNQLPSVQSEHYDVSIVQADLRELAATRSDPYRSDMEVYFSVPDLARFCITNGSLIRVDCTEEASRSRLAVYLMGSCMGAILVQRGAMLLHGSCVTDGKRSVLISGESGAGKSTAAAEFLKRGWKLVTDDVACILDKDGCPMIQSSYPSQKLWQDALDRYERKENDIHSLYFSEEREKFGVNVSGSFYDGVCPLSLIVRLLPADRPCYIGPIDGMAKVDQLLRNTYRAYFISEQNRPLHFQRCVTLSAKVPMALVIRENGRQCADTLYDLIINYLEGDNHD